MYRGMGAEPDLYGASWCGSGWPWDMFCSAESKRSTVEQIIMDESDYGARLSEESRRRAEQMAREAIAADDRCNYSGINSMGWIEKFGCNVREELGFKRGTGTDYTLLALAVAGVAALSLVKR